MILYYTLERKQEIGSSRLFEEKQLECRQKRMQIEVWASFLRIVKPPASEFNITGLCFALLEANTCLQVATIHRENLHDYATSWIRLTCWFHEQTT